MPNDAVAVTIKGVMPTANGCAVFLGTDEKTFVIYVDHSVGNAIQMTLNGVKRERPLTHDLIASIFLDDARMLELLEPYRGQRARLVRILERSGITAPRYGPRLSPRDIRRI
jgi:hypothetical protein